jgi:hypothetical protein
VHMFSALVPRKSGKTTDLHEQTSLNWALKVTFLPTVMRANSGLPDQDIMLMQKCGFKAPR